MVVFTLFNCISATYWLCFRLGGWMEVPTEGILTADVFLKYHMYMNISCINVVVFFMYFNQGLHNM